jgi:hypothetical protein
VKGWRSSREDRGEGFPVLSIVLLAVAGVCAIAALAARARLTTAVPFAALAATAAALGLIVGLFGTISWTPPPRTVAYLDPGIAIAEAFATNRAFARENILEHLKLLDRGPGGGLLGPIGEEKLRALVAMSPEEFLDWAEAQIALLEART